jgi:hypothetical protein
MRRRDVRRRRTCSLQRAVAPRAGTPVLFIEVADGSLKPLRELTLEQIISLAKAGS